MKKSFYTIIAILLLVGLFFAQRYQNFMISDSNFESSSGTSELSRDDYLPHSSNQIVHHKTYSLSYNEKHEQAEWTVHILRKGDI